MLILLLALALASPPAPPISGGHAPAQRPPCAFTLTSWNIERGLQLPKIDAELRRQAPALALLQEVDRHARRTRGADIAQSLAHSLQLAFTFAPEFNELSQAIDRRPALHGQATLASFPASSSRVIAFDLQSNHWSPRWFIPNWPLFQRRLGARIALATDFGPHFTAYNIHLESRGPESVRLSQINDVLADIARYPPNHPIILAGDLNTRARNAPATQALLRAGFRLAAGGQSTTTHGAAIDWIFIRGPLSASQPAVHHHVRASDHFPLSTQIHLPCQGSH